MLTFVHDRSNFKVFNIVLWYTNIQYLKSQFTIVHSKLLQSCKILEQWFLSWSAVKKITSCPEILIQQVWCGFQESAFLTSSHIILKLPVQRTPFENYCSRTLCSTNYFSVPKKIISRKGQIFNKHYIS